MVVGICDDCKEDREKIKLICEKFLAQLPGAYQILEFENGKELMASDTDMELIILDIEMPELSGIDVKEHLQRMGKRTMIIFVTNHDELVLSAFGINVYGFVIKKTLERQLVTMLESAIMIINQYVMLAGEIDSREILYVKSERVYSKLYMSDGSNKLLRIPLKNLEKKLEVVGFIRTHRTYLVNGRWINKILKKEVYVEEKRIPISIRLQGEVNRKYREYCEKNARYC